jgi:peptidoglycan/xylan/chitin deacetylase (PgdA/CDA1 family)
MRPFALFRLNRELGLWRARGRTPRLWWRDDDARGVTPALERLLARAGELPICLAVVPDGDLAGLARRLEGEGGVTVCQHGVDHLNRRAPGAPKSETGEGESVAAIALRIAEGKARLADAGLPPRGFVPPFNHDDPATSEAAQACGFSILSAGDEGAQGGGLRHVGTHVDILRWKGGARFKGRGRVLSELRRELERRRLEDRPGAAIGLLTHHLEHDAAAWAFLDWFVPFSRDRFCWPSLDEVAQTAS